MTTLPPAPRLAYLVLATPRSGSTLLCESLLESGVAGRPLEHFEVFESTGLPRQPREYFGGIADRQILDVLAPLRSGEPTVEAPHDWWSRILREGTGANGVWGGKLMWGHTAELLRRVRRLDGLGDADLAASLHTLLGDPKLILMVRGNKVAQAVSLWRAVQTQRWRGDNGAGQPVYRFAAIDHLRAQLEADDAAWRSWLAEHQLPYREVRYADLAANLKTTVGGVLRGLGLDERLPEEPPLPRQRDTLSVQWAELYRKERAT